MSAGLRGLDRWGRMLSRGVTRDTEPDRRADGEDLRRMVDDDPPMSGSDSRGVQSGKDRESPRELLALESLRLELVACLARDGANCTRALIRTDVFLEGDHEGSAEQLDSDLFVEIGWPVEDRKRTCTVGPGSSEEKESACATKLLLLCRGRRRNKSFVPARDILGENR